MKFARTTLACLSAALVPLAMAGPPLIGNCPVLPPDHLFNTPIDTLPVHPQSAAFLQTISSTPRRLHLDLGQSEDMRSPEYWGIPYNVVQGRSFAWPSVHFDGDGAPDESDCARGDGSLARPCTGLREPARLPISPQPLVEGGISGNKAVYNDHHILSVDTDTCTLWESYLSYTRPDGGWDIYGSAAFDLRSNSLRPAGWTSADAAGFPILPLLLKADEASADDIRHALRFTIQSHKIRSSYTWPARHLTRNGDASASKPPMGQLFRLRADYPAPETYNVQARAILRALKTYGMYIADGGSDMYITGDPSRLWSDATISQVQSVPHTAFEAVDLSPVMAQPGFDSDSARVPYTNATPAFSASASGPLQQLNLWAAIQVSAPDAGRTGGLYVAALVPGVGLFALSPGGWVPVADANLPAASPATLGSHMVSILAAADVAGLRGTQVFAGYGTSPSEMLERGTFGQIYTVP